jgi:predicted chitinase
LFRGRGYVQITGRANYAAWSDRLGRDFVSDPDIVSSEPAVAARILVEGMKQGTFRRRRLDQFINDKKADFVGARDIINGDKHLFDKHQTKSRGMRIAEIAWRYLAALQQQPDPLLSAGVVAKQHEGASTGAAH